QILGILRNQTRGCNRNFEVLNSNWNYKRNFEELMTREEGVLIEKLDTFTPKEPTPKNQHLTTKDYFLPLELAVDDLVFLIYVVSSWLGIASILLMWLANLHQSCGLMVKADCGMESDVLMVEDVATTIY
ncbi:hypothetical protein V2J09_009207, partial [Rumex salicifolius]